MIGSALERGSLIVMFDEHGRTLFSKAKGVRPQRRAGIHSDRHHPLGLSHLHLRRARHDGVR